MSDVGPDKSVIRMMKSAEAQKLLKEIRSLLKDKNIPDKILTTATESYLKNNKINDLADPLFIANKAKLTNNIVSELNAKAGKKQKPKNK